MNKLSLTIIILNPVNKLTINDNKSFTKINYFQVLEWIYFQKYGVSFIEQFSLNYISPWIGGGNDNNQQVPGIYIYDIFSYIYNIFHKLL